jgi:signal transduction histidine kinase
MNIEMKSKIIDYEGKKAIMSMARNIGERKAVEKKIISTIIETEEKERKRFAAELHDGLGPILSTIKLYADLLKNKSNSNINNDELVQNIDELVGLAISTSKEISNNITPTILHDFGLASAIHEFCGYINKTMSINISVDTKNYTFDKRGLEETILYQATKELINNTLKHASAENVKIQLKNTETQIILYYRDDGKGFNVNEMIKNSTGLGLNNIVNKVKTIKGTCDFNSEEGKGMFVLIAVKV